MRIFTLFTATILAVAACKTPETESRPDDLMASQETPSPVDSDLPAPSSAERPPVEEEPKPLTICGQAIEPAADSVICGWTGSQRLTKRDADVVADHGRLTSLTLSWSTVDEDLVHLEMLSSLRSLTLQSTHVTGAGIARLTTLEQLEELDVSKSYYLKDEDLGPVAQLESLETLAIEMTSITDDAIAVLEPLNKLKSLSLRWTSVGDAAVESLAKIASLQSVDLRNTGISIRGVQQLRRLRPELEVKADVPSLVFEENGVQFWSNGDVVFKGMSANIDSGEVMLGRWDVRRAKMKGEGKHADSARVVKFDRKREAVHLFVEDHLGDEDPPRRQIVFLVEDNKLTKVFDVHLGTYGDMRLRFPGDGTARYTTDDWTSHSDHGNEVHEIVLRTAGTPAKLVVKRKIATGEKIDPETLSACPYVYVKQGDDEFRLVGEILRDLRGKSSYALQELALGGVSGGELVVRLAEEKDEVTYLDELYVEVDGVRVDAHECTGGEAAWCLSDRTYLRMIRGDEHVSTYQIAPGARSVVLRASGYYHPVVSERAKRALNSATSPAER